jgi:hypothetical protein
MESLWQRLVKESAAGDLQNICKQTSQVGDLQIPAKAHPAAKPGVEPASAWEEHECTPGDSVLFNGILCFSGQPYADTKNTVDDLVMTNPAALACASVKASQDSTGRLFRSPLHKYYINAPDSRWHGQDGLDGVDSFSGDMALGAILYTLQTRDLAFFTAWMNHIERTEGDIRGASLRNLGGDKSGLAMLEFFGQAVQGSSLCETASDDKCSLLQAIDILDLMYLTAQYLGVTPTETMRMGHALLETPVDEAGSAVLAPALASFGIGGVAGLGFLVGKAAAEGVADGLIPVATVDQQFTSRYNLRWLELKLFAKKAKSGFRTHLPAVKSLIYRALGYTQLAQDVGVTLTEREGKNPFFNYVHTGYTKTSVENTMEACGRVVDNDIRNEWMWERSFGSDSWDKSMGWDCVAMINLMYKKLPLTKTEVGECLLPVAKVLKVPSTCSRDVSSTTQVLVDVPTLTPCDVDALVDDTCSGFKDVVQDQTESFACTQTRKVMAPFTETQNYACKGTRNVNKQVDGSCSKVEKVTENICKKMPWPANKLCSTVTKDVTVNYACKVNKAVNETFDKTCQRSVTVQREVDESYASTCSRVVQVTVSAPYTYACQVAKKVPGMCPTVVQEWKDKVETTVEQYPCEIEQKSVQLVKGACSSLESVF